ncbi:MAG: barstar family protein [Oscillospiraceae bacterium]|jgi:RNAse (barnase) inhibitor barstar|nr:barstar family protein [Oscillospiraceae bacterium]
MKRLDFHWTVSTWTFCDKKRVPISVENDAEFFFINDIKEINEKDDAYVVIIKNEDPKEDLLNEYYTKFKFPPYFGFNWNALNDCLGGLGWIEQKNVIVYHERIPTLNQRDTETYLDILRGMVALWKKYEKHNFEVYFNLYDYEKVQQIMRK